MRLVAIDGIERHLGKTCWWPGEMLAVVTLSWRPRASVDIEALSLMRPMKSPPKHNGTVGQARYLHLEVKAP
jgi:hypothetical protein